MADVAIDADVLIKAATYGLLKEVAALIAAEAGVSLILGASKFTVLSRLRRVQASRDTDEIVADFQNWLSTATIVEPDEEEAEFAAKLELAAQNLALALDAGESQLAAVTIFRLVPILATGDKRAIRSLERLLQEFSEVGVLRGKIACLEQLFLLLIIAGFARQARSAVCANPEIDRAATICFACNNDESRPSHWISGFRSYVSALSTEAPTLLFKCGS